MQRVTGIGGIFFKAQDPKALRAWYQQHLDLPIFGDGEVVFEWRELEAPEGKGMTVWSPFPQDTKYFAPSQAPFMINYRVANLDSVLAALRAEGVTVDDKIEDTEYGRFGWATDPEGNRFELWEPPPAKPA